MEAIMAGILYKNTGIKQKVIEEIRAIPKLMILKKYCFLVPEQEVTTKSEVILI